MSSNMDINTLTDIKHIFYINLEHRTDRKAHIEQQLTQLGLPHFERFNAIKTANGAIGCSMSHLKCLQLAQERNYAHLLICEDDTTFLNMPLFTQQLNTFFQRKTVPRWDVLLIAGNNVPPYRQVDDTCIQVGYCQTTTCYLVQSHYYATLIANIKTGIQLLMAEPHNHRMYAIDKYWIQLQQKDTWLLIVPLTVVQKEDYSDIEKRPTNYIGLMTDLNKPHLFKRTPPAMPMVIPRS
jgi:hypothetical protein